MSTKAQVKLPSIISSGMVLQQGVNIPVWGWAAPGEQVTVLFNDKQYQAIASPDGKWSVSLLPMKGGGAVYEMKISGRKEIVLKDILIGEVWFCSGQSNMAFKMEDSGRLYDEDIRNSGQQKIREFKVRTAYAFQPRQDVMSEGWKSAGPEQTKKFSAVAYFFARGIADRSKVPVGIINSSWGGTPLEAWTAESAFEGFSEYLARIQQNKLPGQVDVLKNYEQTKLNEWDRQLFDTEVRLNIANPQVFLKTSPDTSWHELMMPKLLWEAGRKNITGSFWLRKEISLSKVSHDKGAQLNLGKLYENDTAYVNGQKIGFTTGKYKDRNYVIPAGILKSGKNTIHLRIVNRETNAGFEKRKNPFNLIYGKDTVSLTGTWQYKPAAVVPGMVLERKNFPHRQPGVIYNAMVSPLVPYAIKGVVWYQGEENVNRAKEYGQLFPAMIKNWRKAWNTDFPFLFVQLPKLNKTFSKPGESRWAELREAQTKALSLPLTAMSVNHDLGEADNIHPAHKKAFADRLVKLADEVVYDTRSNFSGPFYKKMLLKADTAWIEFDAAANQFANQSGVKLKHFAIAGKDLKFVWAEAELIDGKIKVWQKGIKNPAAVRYAWADNPEGADLYNKSGMPVPSFRTDTDDLRR